MRNSSLMCIVSTIASLLLTFSVQGQLGQALNNTNLTWTTGFSFGSPDWSPTTSQTHDGSQAARSRTLSSSSKTATLQTSVTGPGTLTFWMNIPSFSFAELYFVTGSATQAVFFAWDGSWQQHTAYLGAGTQTLKWIYAQTVGTASDSCYLDEVYFTPGATAPFITNQPPSQSQVPGVNTIFRVGAAGTPPLSFQWHFQGTNLPGATASELTITNTGLADLGTYRVTVSNSVDSITSSNATLEFGHVTSWGREIFGETAVPPGATNIIAVAAGGLFSLALKADGTVMAWGDNQFGQTTVPIEATNIIGIAAGWGHALALQANGHVLAWGRNSFGQTNVPAGLSNVVSIKGGNNHSLALRADGQVVAWGDNRGGQTNVPVELTNTVAISTSSDHSLALTRDGRVIAWGTGSPSVLTIPGGLSNVVGIVAGGVHNAILKADGTVFAWGTIGFGVTNVPPGV
ncbi:MAG: hypothetical protein H7Y43_03175, partial [Akkermansiaceae bacterium]|nr:hypothetical protein [Verrucomicrobiales bacterium]